MRVKGHCDVTFCFEFCLLVFILLFWRNFPLRKALIGDSVISPIIYW